MNPDVAYLEHIAEAIRRIQTYTTGGRRAFEADLLTQDGVIRNLEVIGEATRRLSANLRRRYPEVPWQRMAAMRDVLIHNYLGVDLRLVWDAVEHRLPEVQAQIDAIRAIMAGQDSA
ncbi:DUF86 domain-containing protein [Azospirillum sp.]|uniref:HepT-like ribonuclease domain-containing protein n=1 Tax=Azospirillum sp. TaxID=34012 RepID=UPI002D617EBE|nr:DUF86 domain-containing protein [Azospirillum sp.]HYD65694.1 DUF86 domain-containing protein [Azospirillum sp.]